MSSDGDPMEAAEPVAGVPRVLFLDQSAELGGAEWSLLDLMTRWSSEPGGVELVTLQEGAFAETARRLGLPTVVIDAGRAGRVRRAGGAMSQLAAMPGVVRVVRELQRRASRFDVLYANTQKAAVVGCLASLWPGKRRFRGLMVWHLRDLLTGSHFSGVNRRVVIGLINWGGELVIANSQATADAFRAAGGRTRVEVVHNGIDERSMVAGASAVAAVRRGLVAEGGRLVGVFGRLTSWKGQHLAVDALSSLPQDVQLIVVGGALFDGDRAYAQTLRQRVEELGLSPRVHFLGQRDDVPALMHACDVVLHTSTSPEPFGRVIVEGMLCGKPVIATDGGGVREILDDGVTGLIVTPGDAGALAAAIGRLLGDAAFAARLAAAGQAAAAERFTVGQMVTGVQKAVAATQRSDVRPAHPR